MYVALLILLLCGLVALDVWATHRVLRSDAMPSRRRMLVIGIWLLPVIGVVFALDAIDKSSVRASTPEQKPHPPMPGIVDAVPASELAFLGLTPESFEPDLDQPPVAQVLDAIVDPIAKARATNIVQRVWLLQLRDAFWPAFRLFEGENTLILTSLDNDRLRGAADFIERTRSRVARVLDGVARFAEGQKSIVLVMDDEDAYYNYVSPYYPDEGEFAFSGGICLHGPFTHFVVKRAEWHVVEPTIAHEMTHSAVAHLPLPLWLNEGLAVNTERRLSGTSSSLHYTSQETRAKHLAFWGEEEMQQFWSGESFQRPDDGQMLSYDLARSMVELMSGQWDVFARFVAMAHHEDAGARAARECLEIDLGHYVCAMLERDPALHWAPDPPRWDRTQTDPTRCALSR